MGTLEEKAKDETFWKEKACRACRKCTDFVSLPILIEGHFFWALDKRHTFEYGPSVLDLIQRNHAPTYWHHVRRGRGNCMWIHPSSTMNGMLLLIWHFMKASIPRINVSLIAEINTFVFHVPKPSCCNVSTAAFTRPPIPHLTSTISPGFHSWWHKAHWEIISISLDVTENVSPFD